MTFGERGKRKMGIFCTRQSEGCLQDSISFVTVELNTLSLQLELPEGFQRMEEERLCMFYPRTGRPDIVLEDSGGVQITGQSIGQKIKAEEVWSAAQALQELTEEIFPTYSISPVYLCREGSLPVGWFRMEMADQQTEHIKALSVIKEHMVLLTFTYPAAEAVKWKSILRYGFGTWREADGED